MLTMKKLPILGVYLEILNKKCTSKKLLADATTTLSKAKELCSNDLTCIYFYKGTFGGYWKCTAGIEDGPLTLFSKGMIIREYVCLISVLKLHIFKSIPSTFRRILLIDLGYGRLTNDTSPAITTEKNVDKETIRKKDHQSAQGHRKKDCKQR